MRGPLWAHQRLRSFPFPFPMAPVPVITEARLDTTGPDIRVEFTLRNGPATRGSFLVGLRAGDAERTAIRHLTVSLREGGVAGLSTYDFGTGTRTVHPRCGASCSDISVTARFPRASLAGLGSDCRVTAYSAFNGRELQSGCPVAVLRDGGISH